MEGFLAIRQHLPHLVEKGLRILLLGLGQVQVRRGLLKLTRADLQLGTGLLKFDLELKPRRLSRLVCELRLRYQFQGDMFRQLSGACVFPSGFCGAASDLCLAHRLRLIGPRSLVSFPCTGLFGLGAISLTPCLRPGGPGFLRFRLCVKAQLLGRHGGGPCFVPFFLHREAQGFRLFGLLPQLLCFLFRTGTFCGNGCIQILDATSQLFGEALSIGQPCFRFSLGAFCFLASLLGESRTLPELLLFFLSGFGCHLRCRSALASLLHFLTGSISVLTRCVRLRQGQLGPRMLRFRASFCLKLDGLCVRKGHLSRAQGCPCLFRLGPGIHRFSPCTLQVSREPLDAFFQTTLFRGKRLHLLQHRIRGVARPGQRFFQAGHPHPRLHQVFLEGPHFRAEALHLHVALLQLILHFLNPSVFVSPQLLLLGLQFSMPSLERGFLLCQRLQATRQLCFPVLDLRGNGGGQRHPRSGNRYGAAGIQEAAQVALESGRGDRPGEILIRRVGSVHVIDEHCTCRCLAKHDHRGKAEARVLLDAYAELESGRVVPIEHHQHRRTLDHSLERLFQIWQVFQLDNAPGKPRLDLCTS